MSNIQQQFDIKTGNRKITAMSQIQQIKRALQQIKQQKCQRKDCLSNNRGNLQIVWFGKQYESKQISCCCCYMLDDQKIKKSLPATYNVLPMLKFTDKLLDEYKIYESRKKTATWHPLLMKQKKTQLMGELGNFQSKLVLSLSSLQTALQGFMKKVCARNREIFTHATMSQIVEMNGKSTFEGLVDKINALVKQLNYSELTKNYEFQRIQIRNRKIEKVRQKINQVVQKVDKALSNLIQDIKKRNQAIAKI